MIGKKCIMNISKPGENCHLLFSMVYEIMPHLKAITIIGADIRTT